MILACGEALFDMIAIETDVGRAFRPVFGGSPLNVAFGLSRLGREVAYLTKLSTDFFGRDLLGFIEREGIDPRFVVTTERHRTMLAFVAFDAEGHADYSFYTDNAADRSLEVGELPRDLPAALNCVHFGSISLALEPTASSLMELMRRVAPTRVVALDPNIRASIIPDRARWLERFEAMLPLTDYIKASAEDVDWILGGPQDIEAVARDWSRRGPALAIVTDGGRGVAVGIGGASLFLPAPRIAVVDTVGAGDTFHAAMLARLDEEGLLDKGKLRGLDLASVRPIVDFAMAAAAITVSRRGADLPRRAEVAAFMANNG
jgi:fructokinase